MRGRSQRAADALIQKERTGGAFPNLLSTTVLRRPCALAHQDARQHDPFHREAIDFRLYRRLAASMLGFIAVRHPLEAGRRHPSWPSL